MEHELSIGEVSRLLNIPEHTLRYWQDAGIFSIRQETNNYRKYTMADLLNIAEVAFYRNIGIPVRQMERFNRFGLEDYSQILDDVKLRVEKQIEELQAMHQLISLKERHIQEINALRQRDYSWETVPFGSIVRFSYSDRDKLIEYTRNPSLYVRCIDTQDLSREIRGIICEKPSAQDSILWEARETQPSRFASFLIEEYPEEGYSNNIQEKLAPIQKQAETGILLANFLMSEVKDGRKIDYLKGYVEIVTSL
jgi:DNA-binding transcriptional MerR regulator